LPTSFPPFPAIKTAAPRFEPVYVDATEYSSPQGCKHPLVPALVSRLHLSFLPALFVHRNKDAGSALNTGRTPSPSMYDTRSPESILPLLQTFSSGANFQSRDYSPPFPRCQPSPPRPARPYTCTIVYILKRSRPPPLFDFFPRPPPTEFLPFFSFGGAGVRGDDCLCPLATTSIVVPPVLTKVSPNSPPAFDHHGVPG